MTKHIMIMSSFNGQPSCSRSNQPTYPEEINRDCPFPCPCAPCCSLCLDWRKILTSICLVIFYQCAKAQTFNEAEVHRDLATFLVLIGTSMWLSIINLEPRCLTFYKPLKFMYDVIAVTVFANFILDCIWTQVMRFLNTMVAITYKYLEESFLSDYIYDYIDPENMICLPDIVAVIFILWVLYCFGILCRIKHFFEELFCRFVYKSKARKRRRCCCS